MEIFKASRRPTEQAGSDHFTGTVWMEPIVTAPDPARIRALRVHFTPGARTDWHTHPLGQTLYVVSGVGRVQKSGEPVREILPGDTVWIAPNEKHWHGAAPDHAMVHIALQEALDGSHVEWMEKVGEEDYGAPPED